MRGESPRAPTQMELDECRGRTSETPGEIEGRGRGRRPPNPRSRPGRTSDTPTLFERFHSMPWRNRGSRSRSPPPKHDVGRSTDGARMPMHRGEDGKVEGDMLSVEDGKVEHGGWQGRAWRMARSRETCSASRRRMLMAQWTSSASRMDADEHNGQMTGWRAASSASRTDGEDILSVEEVITRSMATSSASRTA